MSTRSAARPTEPPRTQESATSVGAPAHIGHPGVRRGAAALLAGACCMLLLPPSSAAADPWPPAPPAPPEPPAIGRPSVPEDFLAGIAPARPADTASVEPGTRSAADAGPAGSLGGGRADALAQRVNRAHTAAGCAKLRRDGRLDAAARKHARDMAARGTLSHSSGNGDTPDDRAAAAGYGKWSGELIAVGQRSAGQTVRAWRRSPEHRRVMLDCGHTELGAGVAERSGRLYWTLELGRA